MELSNFDGVLRNKPPDHPFEFLQTRLTRLRILVIRISPSEINFICFTLRAEERCPEWALGGRP